MTTTVPDHLNLTPSPEILEVIAEVDLQIHHCLAELIDNCLDELKAAAAEDTRLEPRIDVQLPTSGSVNRESTVSVGDNGRGMGVDQLQEALRAGSSGKQMLGTLGMFGMGFNIATARLGSITEVRTGRSGDAEWVIATINLRRMVDEGSYDVPLRTEPKDIAEHGTLITVRNLKDDTVTKLSSTSAIKNARTRLGRIYTYMLRDPQGGHSGAELMGGDALSVYLNGVAVEPHLPCIWDPSRSVDYKGVSVPAAREIDIPLTDAYACMSCGKWFTIAHDVCDSCGGRHIETRSRRLWGWIGVQRYVDNAEIGFSFFRHGRCLVENDQALFKWETPDGEREVEYPVELGKGRIVGEIHLDHAKPQVRKTDFDRESRDWRFMVEKIRGDAPLRPNIARDRGYRPNQSILASYFNAFRRNDPGVASLMPGNGKSALVVEAKAWAKKFREGDPDYLTDQKWFEAAQNHDRIKAGRDADPRPDDAADTGKDDWLINEGLADLADSNTLATSPIPEEEPPKATSQPETDDERFGRYKNASVLLPETNKEIMVDTTKTTLRAYATTGVQLTRGGLPGQFAIRSVAGEVEVYVDEASPLVADFGWGLLDTALLCAAADLKDLYQFGGSVDELVRVLLLQYPDRRIDANAVRDRAEGILDAIRDRLAHVTTEKPAEAWEALSPEARREAENAAVAITSDVDWDQCVDGGEFARYVEALGISNLIEARPDLILDGRVFKATYAALGDGTRQDQIARLVGLIGDLRRMLGSSQSHKTIELQRFLLSAELLHAEIVDG